MSARSLAFSAATEVFAERGFHAANVSHICEAAGIGRGTLYQYFANKRSVLTAPRSDEREACAAMLAEASIRWV